MSVSPILAPTLIKCLGMREYWCRISGQITLHLRKIGKFNFEISSTYSIRNKANKYIWNFYK